MLTALCLTALLAGRADANRIKLGEAARNRRVRVTARSASGHSSIAVSISNAGSEAVAVDVFASVFVPAEAGYQRLGVPRVEHDTGDTVVNVGPGGTWRGEMPCVCLDESRSSPPTGKLYRIIAKLVSAERRRIFAFWNRIPQIPQGKIQSAVWSDSLSSLKASIKAMATAAAARHESIGWLKRLPFARPAEPRIAVSDGMTYVLAPDGVIRLEDHQSASGLEPLELGKDFRAMFASGGKVYAAREHPFRGVRLYQRDGTRWKELAKVQTVPTAVVPASDKATLLATGSGLEALGSMQLSEKQRDLASVSIGTYRGRKIAAGVTPRGLAKHFTLAGGRPSVIGRGCSFFGVGEDLFAVTCGRRVLWQSLRARRTVAFNADIDRTLIEGRYLVVVSGGKAHRLQPDGRWKRQELPEGVVDCALDGTSGDLHLLTRDGKVTVLRGE